MSQEKGIFPLPYLTRDMLAFEEGSAFSLVVQSLSTVASRFTIRGATREGPFSFAHLPTSDSLVKTETFRLPNIPIWISIVDVDGSFSQGNCYATVGLAVNGDTLYTLVSGYITALNGLTWPNANLQPSLMQQGELISLVGANPAAGAEISQTVTAGQRWKLKGIDFTLVTDGTAASRVVRIKITFFGTILQFFISPNAQTATLTRHYSCYPTTAGAGTTDGTELVIPLREDLWLPSGAIIATDTTLLKAGDDFGAPNFLVERYFNSF